MDKKIQELKNKAVLEITGSFDLKSLEDLKVKYLGRKGEVTQILRSLADLSIEQKKVIGPQAQALRKELEELIDKRSAELKNKKTRSFDVTRPGKKIKTGHLHPLTLVEKEIIDIFKSMSFSVVDSGPEIETEYYNFDALNIPKNHPAREMHDTFWLEKNSAKNNKMLLRTHTSPMQIRYMEKHKPPFQIIVPGKVFRYEATDASHEINFHQVECLMVGRDISLANLKYTVEQFYSRVFMRKLNARLRPSYFPFVEPGLEIDIQCVKCGGRGCNICKESGWLEVTGAGMVHPNVFKSAGYDPKEYQGFAFGAGVERIAMLKYNIPDIRMFYNGDLRFINQF